MTSRFSETQKTAIRELLDLPGDLEGAFMPDKNHLAITDIRRALHLPPIPYCEFLGPDCWLAGGRVLRWLCSAEESGGENESNGDFDFFFPSLKALNVTARAMLAQGFQFKEYDGRWHHNRSMPRKREQLMPSLAEVRSFPK